MRLLFACLMIVSSVASIAEELNIGFNAVYSEGHVLLTWTHPADQGVYVVERSKDGSEYTPVTVVEQLAAANEVEVREIDNKPLKGLSYYRIKRVSEGETEYSSVVPVQNVKKNQPASLLFPNVKKEENLLKRKNKGTTEIVVVEDEQGNEAYSRVKFVKTGKKLVAVSLDEKLEEGHYLVVASSNNSIYGKKVLIQ